MRRPGGWFINFDPAPPRGQLGKQECDTFSCAHCNRVTFVRAMCDPAELGGYCRKCDKLICRECAGGGSCDPLEAKLERWERGETFDPYRL